jgi:tetratricopeptide (TPR) repeat protein
MADADGAGRGSVPAIWGAVPTRNKNFTGRDEILEQLHARASSSVTVVLQEHGAENPLPRAVQGLGGVGKTAIAIEYAYRYRSEYDIVWWIPADQLASVRASLANLATRLELDVPPAGIDGPIGAVLNALRLGEPYRRWLLIFDNADQPEEIKRLIPDGPGDVLITSRNHRWLGVVDTVPMNVFSREESVEFLLKRVPKGLSEPDAWRLADKLGDLPLALEQAGAMLSETGMLVDVYLQLLDEQVTKIMAEGKSPDYPWSMTAAWKLSVSALRDRLPQALELLRCFAFFGPEPIPRSAVRRGAQPTGTAVSDVISNPILMATAIRELGRYALVTLDGNTVSVHRLIQALLRDELTAEQAADYRHEAQLILAAAAPSNADDPRTWSRFAELLPHVNSQSTDLPASREPAVRELALAAMRYLYQSGDYESGLELANRFIKAWTLASGAENADVLRAQRHRGNILRLLGRYRESYQVTEEAFASCRATLGESDPTTLSLRTSFGADLRARGRFADALALDEESRGLLETAYGPADPRTLRLLSSLALDSGLNSDYGKAQQLYREAFQGMSPATAEATAADVLGAWNGLSWTLRLQCGYQEAYDVIQDAVDYGRDAEGMGPDHLATLRSVIAYTVVCRWLPEKRLDGLEVSKATLDLMTRRFGANHPDTLAMAISMSNLLRTISESHYAEALELAQSTMALYPRVYGENHPYHYGCLTNLALLRRITGDPVSARDLDKRALDGLTSALGPEHHFTLTVAVNLASDYAALGEPGEARRIGEETSRRLTGLLGADHLHTLACTANLALDLIAAGADDTGRELRDKTLDSYASTQGFDLPDEIGAAEAWRFNADFDPPPI